MGSGVHGSGARGICTHPAYLISRSVGTICALVIIFNQQSSWVQSAS